MIPTLQHAFSEVEDLNHIEHFVRNLKRAESAALLLDYDGTLAPFTIDRQHAVPYPGVVEHVQQIMKSCSTRVVIISGRPVREVVALLKLSPAPEIWGSHGFERPLPDGTTRTPRIELETSQALADAGQWVADQGFRDLTELKPGGIAIHWRGLPEETIFDIRERVLRTWFPIAQCVRLTVMEFDGGIEMRIADFDKGYAVRTIVSEMPSDAPIAYLGDDSTDEHAFEALGARGLSVLVRPVHRRTSAQAWLKPPEDLLDFLARWASACRSRRDEQGCVA